MRTDTAVDIRQLNKSFDGLQALQDITLQIPKGTVTGFIGANGAGKSTLMQIMTGIHLPSSGHCLTLGEEAAQLSSETLRHIGYVHQESRLIPWMYVHQLIRFVAGHYPGQWNQELEQAYLKRFSLPLDVKVSTLSPGKRQQLAILLAIGADPELLILDEPASGIDPLARYEFLQILLDMIQSRERTIIISSHILSDIERIIDHVVIFHEARLLRNCAFDELLEEFVQLVLSARDGDLPGQLNLNGKILYQPHGRQALLVMRREAFDRQQLQDKLNCTMQEQPLNFEGIYRLLVAPHSFNHEPLELPR